MKTPMLKYSKPVSAGLLCLLIAATTTAQKLPNVQQVNVYAPENIKVDGKADEWNNQFHAYNHATDVYYTMANDNAHLYLVIQVTSQAIINKIIGGGITLTIQTSGKKSDKGGASVTYPLFDKKNRPMLGMQNKIIMENGVNSSSLNAPALTDSAITARNKQLSDKSKLISVTGITGVDSLISVYNSDGIKTAELFDSKGAYTYELSIDLKLLNIMASNKFAYHVTLNGAAINFTAIKIVGGDGSTASSAATSAAVENIKTQLDTMMGNITAPTDFWGEYTLAKKP